MNHFLAPVLRQQFNLFYRFGYTFIPDALLIPFDGKIDLAQKNKVADLLKMVTPFQYDEEYVILHLKRDTELSTGNVRFEIQELEEIFPLSQQAKVSISQKIDTRIALSDPLFEDSLTIAEEAIIKKEIDKGIDALWRIYFDNETEKKELISLLELDKIYHALQVRSSGKKANELVSENYWAYLFAYERYEYFPKESVGYFYDAGQLFANYKGRPSFENSQLHKLLSSLYLENNRIFFNQIVHELENDQRASGYVSPMRMGELKTYILAPLFLLLKEEIRKAESFTEIKDSASFKHALTNYPLEFKAALILLGAFFKFKTFYDEYYNKLNLSIYNHQTSKLGDKKSEGKDPEAAVPHVSKIDLQVSEKDKLSENTSDTELGKEDLNPEVKNKPENKIFETEDPKLNEEVPANPDEAPTNKLLIAEEETEKENPEIATSALVDENKVEVLNELDKPEAPLEVVPKQLKLSLGKPEKESPENDLVQEEPTLLKPEAVTFQKETVSEIKEKPEAKQESEKPDESTLPKSALGKSPLKDQKEKEAELPKGEAAVVGFENAEDLAPIPESEIGLPK